MNRRFPRTFVGFSSADIDHFRTMLMWKAHEHIDFDFVDVQLPSALNSTNEAYIKSKCRERLGMAGTYALLIGANTRFKEQFVLWEAEVALEQGCRIIGVNLDNWRTCNSTTCPDVLRNVDAMFVPFSSRILAHTLENFERPSSPAYTDWHWPIATYGRLGYLVDQHRAWLPKPPNPFIRGGTW